MKFCTRKFEAEAKARLREQSTDRGFDLTRVPAEGELRFLVMRPYCADCGKLKGSKAKNRYFPERPCSNCGSPRTKLRDFDGNEIGWDKWVVMANEWADREMVRTYGGYVG
jgi:ribosomal protein L37E